MCNYVKVTSNVISGSEAMAALAGEAEQVFQGEGGSREGFQVPGDCRRRGGAVVVSKTNRLYRKIKFDVTGQEGD